MTHGRFKPMIGRWIKKFAVAFAGIGWAIRTQNSFWVHISAAVCVVALAVWVEVERWGWVALTIVISAVIAAELFNTAIEELVRALHPEQDERIGRVLDAAAGAVLVISIASVVVGAIVLGVPLWQRFAG